MSYELNLAAEQSRRTLLGEVRWLRGILLTAIALAAALIVGLCVAVAMLLDRNGPVPQPIAIYAMDRLSDPSPDHRRVLCFRRTPEYARGKSNRCTDRKTACDGWQWTQTDDKGAAGKDLDAVLSEQPPPRIELALLIGGHDTARVIPNRDYDSNMQLALQRAAHAATQTLPNTLQPQNGTKTAAVDDTRQICGHAGTADTEEERRRPVLLLVVNDSAAVRQERTP